MALGTEPIQRLTMTDEGDFRIPCGQLAIKLSSVVSFHASPVFLCMSSGNTVGGVLRTSSALEAA